MTGRPEGAAGGENPREHSMEMQESPPQVSPPRPYDRRWWLVGMAVAVIAVIAVIALFVPRGGGGAGGDMPGMDMGGSSRGGEVPAKSP